MYHGSKNTFKEWDYSMIGQNGVSEGWGFYFTDNKEIAEHYAHKGFLYHVELNIKDTLKDDKKELTLNQVKEIIKEIDLDGWGFLSNYDDVSFRGYDSVLSEAAASCYLIDNDVDIIGNFIGAGEDIKTVLQALIKITNKNSIISNADWIKKEDDEKIIIMFDNTDITIKDIEKR